MAPADPNPRNCRVRLPGTLKELWKQLGASPRQVQRVQFPTPDGPLIIDFAPAAQQAEAPRVPAPAAKVAEAEAPDAPKKVRDTALLHRPVPPMVYDQ